MPQKKTFSFEVWYFKESGKFYTESNWETEVDALGPEGNAPYMQEAVARLRGLRDSGGQGAMPGLSQWTEGWAGPILLNHPEGYPCLILPPKEKRR